MNVPEIHRELAHAWVDGAEVEQWCEHTQSWLSGSLLPSFSAPKYRLKPIPHSIDWSHVNERYIVLVAHKTGEVRLVTKAPTRGPGENWYFVPEGRSIDAENFTSFKRGTVSWDESLVFRPSKEMCAEPVKVDRIGLTAEQWAQIPSEYNWIAKDQDGYWYAHESEPESEYEREIDYGVWEDNQNPNSPFPITTRLPGLLPNLQGSELWEDCLIKRPEVEVEEKKEYVGLTAEQWEKIPSKYDWVAMHEGGGWCAYCEEPRIFSDIWLPLMNTEYINIARPNDLDCSRVAWRDSLTKRPSTPAELYPEGFSWDQLSPRMKFIAKDRSEVWYVYESEPQIRGNSWMAHGKVQRLYYPPHPDIPWESSLRARPN